MGEIDGDREGDQASRGYFPSMKSLEVNLFIQLSDLKDICMRKPIPMIRGNLYRLHQLMNIKFGVKDSENLLLNF